MQKGALPASARADYAHVVAMVYSQGEVAQCVYLFLAHLVGLPDLLELQDGQVFFLFHFFT